MDRGEGRAACRRWIMASIVASVAGCTTKTTTTFDSRVERPLAVPMTRIVVFEGLQSPFFDEWRLHAFVVGMIGRLKSCGLAAQVEHLDEMDLDLNEHVTNALTGFRADAAIVVTARGGNRTFSTDGVELELELRLALDLLEVESKRLTWHADATLLKPANARGSIGLELATSIVARLRDDGLLHACPAPGQPWPDVEIEINCRQERVKIIREAKETPDQFERAAKLKTLPRCS